MSDTKTGLWPSYTGIITRLDERTGPKGPFLSFTIECGSGENAFRKDGTANDERMTALIEMGIGARVYVRGPVTWSERTNAAGGKFRTSTLYAYTVEAKPLVSSETPVETNDVSVEVTEATVVETPAFPAMPEGASDITHQLYTKRDGAKAWRKRPAAQVAKYIAAIDAQLAESTEEVAPVAVETVEESAPSAGYTFDDSGEETAMGAALRAAFA